jgi:hypothetical protein
LNQPLLDLHPNGYSALVGEPNDISPAVPKADSPALPVFESSRRLADDIRTLLEAVREEAEARYVCLFDRKALLLDTPAPSGEGVWALKRFLEERTAALFRIPAALAADQPFADIFETWTEDGFLLFFINGRVGLIAACPNPEQARGDTARLVPILVDRLLRYEPSWRIDETGRGLFLTRPRLDTVVIERPDGEE